MTDVATLPPRPRSVLIDVSQRYGMEAAAFEQTLRATVVPSGCTREQFAAFLVVAREHDLNPLTKEIYAFPGKGGGIQPLVSVDGWIKLINKHPQLDGIDFAEHRDKDGTLVSMDCTIYRKDRSHPTKITEYFKECFRETDPWRKAPARMLRHKALIQCGRIAFGFAGLMDEDDARAAQMIDVTPPPRPRREDFTEADAKTAAAELDNQFADTLGKPDDGGSAPLSSEPVLEPSPPAQVGSAPPSPSIGEIKAKIDAQYAEPALPMATPKVWAVPEPKSGGPASLAAYKEALLSMLAKVSTKAEMTAFAQANVAGVSKMRKHNEAFAAEYAEAVDAKDKARGKS